MTDPSASSSQAESPLPEFVTVAEAARVLRIDPTQVRRYAKRLPQEDRTQDRTKTRGDSPVLLIRLASIQAIRDGKTPPKNSSPQEEGQDKDRTGQKEDRTGQDRPTRETSLLREIIQRQEEEIARLADALQREQETASKLADRIADADARLASILAATRQIEPAQKPSDTPENAQEPQGEASGPVEGKSSDPSSPPRKRWWWPFGTGAGA